MEDSNYKLALNLLLKSLMTPDDPGHAKNHQLILTLGPTPEILQKQGFPDIDLVVTGKVIEKAFFDHAITRGALERAYGFICAPKAIYKSATDGAVVMTYEERKGNPLIIPLHANKQMGRDVVANVIASMYYKEGNAEERWRRDGLLLWEP